MKRILWLSQHPWLPVQKLALERFFGEGVDFKEDVDSFADAEEIIRRWQTGGYDDLVVVAPLWVIKRLCDLGLKPLYGEMEEVQDRQLADTRIKGRWYRFVRFRRVLGVEVKFDPAFDANYSKPN